MSKELTPCVEVVIRRADGKFLTVTNRRRGSYTMPGGKVHLGDGEDFDDPDALERAAKRELEEETGIRVDKLRRITKIVDPNDNGGWACTSFEADYLGQTPRNVEDDTKTGWHSANELATSSLLPNYYRKLFDRMGIDWS